MPRQHRVVDHIVEHLARTDTDYIFGVDGANIEDLYDAAHFCSNITAVLAKHEFSAATMADGYSRSGAGLGVVAATAGGGALNLVPGLGESLASRVPVLALVGQPATAMDGRGSFQDTSGRNGSLDAEALFSAVSVWCRRILTPSDIVTALPEAIAAARGGGPAVLLLPKDIQQAKIGVNGYVPMLQAVSCLRRPGGSATPIRSCARCAAPRGQSRSSPASRWPETMPEPSWRVAGAAARSGGMRAGRERCSRHTGFWVVVSAGCDRRDGPPRCGRSGQERRRCAWWSVPGCR